MPKVIGTPKPRFNLHNRKTKESVIRLVFRYYCRHERHELIYFPSEKVEVKYWDAKARRAKFNRKHQDEYIELNQRLNALEDLVIAIYKETKGCITPADFKNELDYRRGVKPRPEDGPKTPPLLQFLDSYLLEKADAKDFKRGTWKNLQTWATHLKEYAQEEAPGLDYDAVDWNFFNSFKNWLFSPPRNHSQNHAAKGFEYIAQFMRAAEKRGYHSNQTYQDFKIAKEKTVKFALTFEELETLYSLELSDNPRLERVRDLFLIGCYTGLRFSDFTSIRPEHISEEDGQHYLTITTKKTGQKVTIPLFAEAETLLRKYDFQTPKISNQKANDYLKELGQIAGLNTPLAIVRTVAGKREETVKLKWEKLTTHVARRSFATNFYLLGVPAIMLMKITGHTTETQFMGYIAVDAKRNARELAKEVALRTGKSPLKAIK